MRRRQPDPPLESIVRYVHAPDAEERYYKVICVLVPEFQDGNAKQPEQEEAAPEEE
jgi:hypothetical protein